MHFRHFNKDLMSYHVWRQTQTQQVIDNFFEEDMNILNPRVLGRRDGDGIFRMEFPLMQWTIAAQYKVFGQSLLITRINMFLISILSTIGIYTLFQVLLKNRTTAIIGAWAITFSPSFFYYSINPLPDNMALCCSIWGIAFFYLWKEKHSILLATLCGLCLAIGTAVKLPFIVFYIVPFLYLLYEVKNKRFSLTSFLLQFGWFLLPASWYVWVIPTWKGNPVVQTGESSWDSFLNIFSQAGQNLVSTVPELFVNYAGMLFFLAGIILVIKHKKIQEKKHIGILGLFIATTAYYLFEANAIGTSHDYYLFPFYPVIILLVAYGANHLISHNLRFIKYFGLVALLAYPVTCQIRMNSRWNPESPGFNKDLLAYKKELQAATPDVLVVMGNDNSGFIFPYHLDKKGWAFSYENLSSIQLQEMIDKGAKYLYSDSEKINADPEIKKKLGKLILEKGSFKVFELKKEMAIKN